MTGRSPGPKHKSASLPKMANLNAVELARLAARGANRAIVEAHAPDLPSLPRVETRLHAVDAERAPSNAITSARDIGRLVQKGRKRRKQSQQTFADLVGVGRRFLSELENGKATLEFDKVLQVAAAAGIDLLAQERQLR